MRLSTVFKPLSVVFVVGFLLFLLFILPTDVLAGCVFSTSGICSCPANQQSYSCNVGGNAAFETYSCPGNNGCRIDTWRCDTGAEARAICGGGGTPSCEAAGGACAGNVRRILAEQDSCRRAGTDANCFCEGNPGAGAYCDWSYLEIRGNGTVDCAASKCGTFANDACSCGCTDTRPGSGCGCQPRNTSNCGAIGGCQWYNLNQCAPGKSCSGGTCTNVCGGWTFDNCTQPIPTSTPTPTPTPTPSPTPTPTPTPSPTPTPTPFPAWFQTAGGDVHANGSLGTTIPSTCAADCYFSLER